MQTRQWSIEYKGTTYTLHAEMLSGKLVTKWTDENFMTAPTGIVRELNRTLIENRAAEIIKTEERTEPEFLSELLTSLHATDDDFERLQFWDPILQKDPERAIRRIFFKDPPPAVRSPFNCPILRDWFFAGLENDGHIGVPVFPLGDGPFATNDFECFLSSHGFHVVQDDSEEFSIMILGRENWIREEVDEVIDQRIGSDLYIYSQEMFLIDMASSHDPFEPNTGYDLKDKLVLEAFRAGHPALEFVSDGWDGWVDSQPRRKGDASQSTTATDQVDRSPLKELGYTVGQNGLEEQERRQILATAFKEPLPPVESAAYMEDWGEPKSGKRLQRIAKHIAALIGKSRGQHNMATSVKEWTDDLEWLKQEFYRGHMRFHWPGTDIR